MQVAVKSSAGASEVCIRALQAGENRSYVSYRGRLSEHFPYYYEVGKVIL